MKLILTALVMLVLSGCDTGATVASRNLSKAADNFEIERRIVFYNGITGGYIHTIGLLVRLDGSICNFAFDSMLGFIDKEKFRYSYELPTGPGVMWCHSEHDSYEEKAYAALLASEKREDVLKNLEIADLLMARQIQWYKMDDLTTQINTMHKTKYPNHVLYTAKPKEKTDEV